MANLKKTLTSGKELEVSLPSFEDSTRLRQAVMMDLKGIQISFGDMKSGVPFQGQLVTQEMLNTLKNLTASLAGSAAIEAALWPCMARGTWDGQKITKDLFENEEAREDFMEIAQEVLWYSLRPFLKGLVSKLKPLAAGLTSSQK